VILVRCLRYKVQDGKYVFRKGDLYRATVSGDSVEVINHYGMAVRLSLREFNHYFIVVSQL
jgi:hypothetical protein